MKKIGLILLLTSAGFAHSATSTNTIQTTERQAITIGDTVEEMQSRIKASPITVQSYPLVQDKGEDVLAIDYTYEIENMRYIITVVNQHVKNIQTENLNK